MEMDLERVASVAASECVRQHVDIDRLVTLLNGYRAAYGMSRTDLMSAGPKFVAHLGGIIEPDNFGLFRTSPVTFRSGGTSAPHCEIDRLVESLMVNGDLLTPFEWTKQFLWIHPFTDGNGRCAFVLYNMLNKTMDYPWPLPEFSFII